MKKKITSAILTIVLCLSLIAGSTYALFTSKDEVNIAVSSGKVEVKAVLKNLVFASELGDTLKDSSAVITEEDQLLTLTNIVPGDYVTFDIVISNNSTVAISYRTVIQMLNDNGLWDGLVVTIDETPYYGDLIYADWATLLPGSDDIVVPVRISLPVTAGDEYQDKTCKINYRVEAVQGNAPVVNPYTLENGVYYINSEEGMMLIPQLLKNVPHNESVGAINFALTADMDMTDYTWAPIEAHWVNIDGQGHKVSNLNCTTNEVAKSGFIGYLGAGTIKNITLENVTVKGEQAGVVVGQVEAGSFENVIIAGKNTVAYYDDPAYTEVYGGVGAVIGVDVSGNTDKTGITIAEGATIAVIYGDFKTELAGPANEFAFNLAINVTNKGTVTTEGNAICMENGLGYLYTGSEKTLYIIPEDYTSETLDVPEGVTALRNKLLKDNSTIKEVIIPTTLTNFGGSPNGTQAATGGFFYGSAVEKIVLPEGMTEIPVGAFNQASNLKEVNIPSTVTTIGIGAFAGTGLTELTVPASVTTIGGGAFRDMANLTTVTIEGNVNIPSYAFRSCENLKNVYILGDDVTFEKGMIFTRYDTGDGRGINIYVTNETIKERLLAADTAATTYGGYSIVVAEVISTADELKAAITEAQDGDAIILNNDITVTDNWDCRSGGTTAATIIIDGAGHTLKFTNEVYDGNNYHAVFRFTGNATVKNLTFDMSEVKYGRAIRMRAISAASNLIVDNCTFIGNDAINQDEAIVIGDINNTAQINASATITNCTFNNWRRGISDNENAKEIKNIVISGNTFVGANVCVSAYENATFSNNTMENSLVDVRSYTAPNALVVVAENNKLDLTKNNRFGNVAYYYVTSVTELQSALNETVSEITIYLGADISGTVVVNQPGSADQSITIDGQGHKYDGQIKIQGNSDFDDADDDSLIIKNINFETETASMEFIWSADTASGSVWRYAHNVTVDNCTFTAVEGSEAYHTAVGVKFQQAYNIKVQNCVATNMHSLLQAESCGSTVTVDTCEVVNGKNGISFNNTMNAIIKNTVIESVVEGGYGIRHKGEVKDYALTVENCTVSAFVPVLIRNMKATGYTATFSGTNTLNATNNFGYEVVVSAGDWDNDAAEPTAPTGSYTITGASDFESNVTLN